AWDCAGPPPNVSSLNYAAGAPRGAATVVRLSAARTFCVFSYAATDLIVDVSGSYKAAAGERFTAQPPQRILDTRATGTPAAGAVVRVAVPSSGGQTPSAAT